jgi:stage V sporulation protein AE
MDYVRSFWVGGLICALAQILLDKTKMTNARILVLMVVLGCLLEGLGVYRLLIDFAGAGASVPLPGFGYLLAKGVKSKIDSDGFIGIFTGGLTAAASGITTVTLFSFIGALIFNPQEK